FCLKCVIQFLQIVRGPGVDVHNDSAVVGSGSPSHACCTGNSNVVLSCKGRFQIACNAGGGGFHLSYESSVEAGIQDVALSYSLQIAWSSRIYTAQTCRPQGDGQKVFVLQCIPAI